MEKVRYNPKSKQSVAMYFQSWSDLTYVIDKIGVLFCTEGNAEVAHVAKALRDHATLETGP